MTKKIAAASGPLTKHFRDISLKDVPTVGGKNASLGEMYRRLVPRGIRVPGGFAVTADAYWRFLDHNDLRPKIEAALKGLDAKNVDALAACGGQVRRLISAGTYPEDLRQAIVEAYRAMTKEYGGHEPDTAVRSSATAEDLPGASFAGQQETYLNVRGEEALLDAVRNCFASLFTNRAIAYRVEKGFEHMKVALSVAVQKMVRSDLASSGVMFTIDTETGFRDVVLINAAWGLGESVVQGKVTPDQYYVFKPTLDGGYKPIVGRSVGSKESKIIYSLEGSSTIRTVAVSNEDRRRYCLTDEEVVTLARWATEIERYYSKLNRRDEPMDIEWAKDGETGELFIVQARPETVQAERDQNILKEYVLQDHAQPVVTGLSVGSKIGVGRVRIIKDIRDMAKFQPGEVLVTEMTDPDWVPIMKQAGAIVTNSGGRTCHAAIVSRELGTPAVVGTGNGTALLADGQDVTVSCAEGEQGRVYAGKLKYEVRETKLTGFTRPKRTKVMMNVGEPEQAFELSFLPNDGVGLARTEFIFINHVKIHPLALLNYADLKDAEVLAKIDDITWGYTDKTKFFVDRLAEGVARLAAAFYPKPVIVRMSDFKTNEYANLIGGKAYEPVESNPMIGWRGASRYYDPKYKAAFQLECQALKKVRDEMGLTNLIAMIPFCRTPEEGKLVLATMAEAGLKRGRNGLQIYVMAEIPSNVILASEFAKLFDGFSIGSNDLTQLTLGVDRDSSEVARLYDERNPAVYESLKRLIAAAKKAKVKIGICGQAPSDFPEFAQFLVEQGIDSISLNPDTVVKTTQAIAKTEAKVRSRKTARR